MRAASAWALVPLLLLAVPLPAQESDPPVELTVAPGTGRLTVTLGDFLSDGSLRNALQSGLPLRLSVVTELWRDGLFDSERGRSEWRATVVHDPLSQTYQVETSMEPLERVVPSLDDVAELLGQSFEVPVVPTESGRYYYLARLEVETLSLSDLEELGRWLRGDLAPAVTGRNDMEGAVAKGVRRLVVRVLGVPARRFRVRTPSFDVTTPGEAPPAPEGPSGR